MKLKFLILMILIIFLIGCNRKEIKVGVVLPLSGDFFREGQYMKEGFEMALKEINNEGGISGKKIKLIYKDDTCDTSLMKKLIQELKDEEKVVAFTGVYCDDATKKAARFALDNKLIFVSPGINLGKMTEYFFSTKYPLILEAEHIAKYAKEDLGLNNMVIIHDENDRGLLLKEVFLVHFAELKGKIISSVSIEEYESKINEFMEKSDGIFIASLNSDKIVEELRNVGYNGEIFVDAEIENIEPLSTSINNLEGIYYAYPFDEGRLTDDQKSFINRYKSTYRKDFSIIVAESYDALNILVIGLRSCETIYFEGGCMSSVIRKIKDYDGMSGYLTFDKNLWGFKREFVIKSVKNGKFVKVKDSSL